MASCLLEGSVFLEGNSFVMDEFIYLGAGIDKLRLKLAAGSRLLLLGGEPFGEPIVMWWNFVRPQ